MTILVAKHETKIAYFQFIKRLANLSSLAVSYHLVQSLR